MRHVVHAVSLASMLVIASCSRESAVTAETSAFKVTATLQDIMNSQIDPAADFIWESVATTTTAAGTEIKQPQTDEEWLALRHRAITLIEAANLLVIPGRQVAEPGATLEDAGVPGISAPNEIQLAIDADRDNFIRHAHSLHDTAVEALAAIDSKDPDALVEAGGRIDEACESCHVNYWYPNAQPPPPIPAAGDAAKQ